MTQTIYLLSFLTLMTPALSALLILLSFKKLHKNIYKISVGFAWFALALSALLLVLFFISGIENIRLFEDRFICVDIGALGILMLFFVSIVSVVIHLYSVKYMYDEEGYARFFILLDLMIWAIFGLVVAGNLIIMFGFWHMIGILLYFLLVHNYTRKQTYRYGFYTLFTHLLADIPFVIAIYFIYHYYHTTDLHHFLELISSHPEVKIERWGISAASVIGMLIMLSALLKSAQFPFHIWLPYTLEGPNPVSALMHAGIVNAGAFLANRFAPLFVHADEALHLAFVVGFVTAILGSALMMVQNDIKKALAYSTMGQMGYMMLEVGSGAFALAIYHMMVHGLFKASLFLGSGGVIGEARQSPNISDRTLFDFYFSKAQSKMHGWLFFLFFVVLVPALIVWILFETLGEGVSTQGSFLFFFFAWAAGSRVAYALYHGQSGFWKMSGLMIAAFGLALGWYFFAEHGFGGMLYPDRDLFENLFTAAQLPWPFFYAFWTIAVVMLLASWSMVYCKSHAGCAPFLASERLYNLIYQTLIREFYVLDIAEKVAGKMLRFSLAINQKLHF